MAGTNEIYNSPTTNTDIIVTQARGPDSFDVSGTVIAYIIIKKKVSKILADVLRR